jgi:hypothetical protein
MAQVRIKGIEEAEAPKPYRTARTITLAAMAVAALASAGLAWGLRGEALYALRRPAAVELPNLEEATLSAHAGAYARAHVKLAEPAASFRRPFEPSSYQVAQVEGAASPVFVIYAKPDGYAEPRFLPPALVAGRLERAGDLGTRFRGVGGSVPGAAWVLVDGEDPFGNTWILGLEAMLLVFVAFNLAGIAALVRRVG